jgi:hypothetical protein
VAAATALAYGATPALPVVSALTVAVSLGVVVGGFLPPGTQHGLCWATSGCCALGRRCPACN